VITSKLEVDAMSRTNKQKILFFLSAFALGLHAADVRTWTDATGNHLWSDRKNWQPNVDGNHYNIFPKGNWEVIIDGLQESNNFYYSIELADGSGTVTIKGSSESGK
jgi:hypothetical protein